MAGWPAAGLVQSSRLYGATCRQATADGMHEVPRVTLGWGAAACWRAWGTMGDAGALHVRMLGAAACKVCANGNACFNDTASLREELFAPLHFCRGLACAAGHGRVHGEAHGLQAHRTAAWIRGL